MGDQERPKQNSSERKRSADNAWWRESISLANRLQLSYWVVRFCQFLARTLPLNCCYAITACLARVTYIVWPGMRRMATANMRHVLGPEVDDHTLSRTVKVAYRNYFKYLAEFLRFPSLPNQELEKVLDGGGWEHVDRALKAGRGAIFVCFHFGNWDMAGTMIALRGYPLNVVVDRFEPKRLNDAIQGLRVAKGVKIIPVETAARRVVHALRHNEILGLLIDVPTPRETGVPVRLFDGACYLPGGAATLSLKTGAPVIPGYVIRKPDNTFEGRFAPAIEFEPSGDLELDVQRLTQSIVDHLSVYVRQHPDQWFLFRELWTKEDAAPEVAWAT